MIRNSKYLKLVLSLLFGYGMFSQNVTDDLILKVENKKIYYQLRNFSEPYSDNASVVFENILHLTLTNTSDTPYLFIIDTTTFMLHNYRKEMFEEYNIPIDSTAIRHPSGLLFRPWLKIYDSSYLPVTTGWYFFRPDWESEWGKERSELMSKRIKQRDEAYCLYYLLISEEYIDMPEYYYKVKQNQHIIYPKDSLSFVVPVSLPDNDDMLGTFGEYYKLEGDNSYKAYVEFDNQYTDLEKILTQEDKDSLKNVGIKIFNGVLRSNEIELLPITNKQE